MSKINATLSNGCQDKVATIEKPPMFAFCLKPRGLELPNRGSKHRSHRRISVSGKSSTSLVDHDGFNSYGKIFPFLSFALIDLVNFFSSLMYFYLVLQEED